MRLSRRYAFLISVDDERVSSPDQSRTAKRRAFADKFGQVERVAFEANVPGLPFVDAPLAASVGMGVDDFALMAGEPAHLAVVFDALAHSKTTLVSREEAEARIASWRADDGGLDADAFGKGLRKGLLAVLAANAVLYFFVASGVAVVCRVFLDVAAGA